ncbi:MAG TPA: hypothetical protein ENG78_04340 [Acidiferrobacteraceae bacterium]|nr:hypothetical protein [Acidiferrobacteraceae bacterium]HEX20033.1 hypothetical protein [Acidiferrobacteraceae bacterium]
MFFRLHVLKFIFCLVSILLLAACATTKQQNETAPFWPALPDLPRFQYELSLRSDLSISKPGASVKKFRNFMTGRNKRASIYFLKPFDVAARGGRIIVSDSVTHGVYLFDVPLRKLYIFGLRGKGRLLKPLGVAVDNNINFYVADVSKRCVTVYNSNGHFLRFIGNSKDLDRPTDVAVSRDGSRIYVIDVGGVKSMNHRVVVYNAEGKKLFTIGERGRSEGKFNLPTHGAVAPDGTLYVLDTGNFRVQAFDRNGRFLRTWGEAGLGFGQFARPRGIAVDDDGNVYVTDARFGNFQIFDPKGRLLLAVGRWGLEDKPGRYSLIAGVAVDETGRIYVVDQRFKKVDVIRRLSENEGRQIKQKYRR